MAIGNGVVIRFLADTGSAVRNIGKLEKATGRAMSAGDRARNVWSKMGPALAGGALAAGYAVGRTLVDGVQAAIEDESSQAALAQAMRNTTGATADQIAGMEDYVSAAQQRAAVDDGEVRKGLSRLLRSTKSATRAQALMNTAMEISAATGKPLGTVVEALAKYNDGNVGALKRLGVSMGDATRNYGDYMAAVKNVAKAEQTAAAVREDYGADSDEYARAMEKVNDAVQKVNNIKGNGGIKWLAELNTQFKGSVASKMNTTAGGMEAVSVAYGELIESLGKGVMGSGESGSGELSSLADAMYDAQPVAEDIGQSLHDVALSLADAAQYIGPVVDGFNRLNDMGDGILTDGTLVTIGETLDRFRIVAATLTGNEQAAIEALASLEGGSFGGNAARLGNTPNGGNFPVNPYGVYRPMVADPVREAQRTADADARAAARGAQTRKPR